ncbi:hypothetical protein [Nocardia brasiliensis]|uniref:hypothetical protein n=1 Tax=Nocardia brasiliensis TaxID=37326 RepID=UPI002455E07F|nr:hypothetical protein [Nocardia brasiliensis]
MTVVFYGPEFDLDQLRGLHQFLTARGWVLDPAFSHPDEDGYPTDSDDSWHYPASYGGAVMNDITEVTPHQLTCHFRWAEEDDEETALVVTTTGNEYGCDAHRIAEHALSAEDDDASAQDFTELGELLDDLEPQARAADPRVLIECRFFGPCGQLHKW